MQTYNKCMSKNGGKATNAISLLSVFFPDVPRISYPAPSACPVPETATYWQCCAINQMTS